MHSLIFRSIALVLLMSITGCGNKQKTATPAISSSASADTVPADAESASLAEQSLRDVEAILQAQAAAQKQSEQPPADPNAIVWNEPPPAVVPPNPKSTVGEAPLFRAPAEGSETRSTVPAAAPPDAKPATKQEQLAVLMADLSRALQNSAASSDTPLRQLGLLAALSMIDPQRRVDPKELNDLSAQERQVLSHLQAFFAELGESLADESDVEQSIAQTVTRLREALGSAQQLKLLNAVFCTRVGGFGDYSPFDRTTFLAGTPQKVIVYLEIANFTSELNQRNEYVTELSQQLAIINDRDGITVWREDWQTAIDESRNKRQDFFTVQVVTLPKALSVGKYQLKVRVRDEQTGAETEGTIPFEMVADPKMAVTPKK